MEITKLINKYAYAIAKHVYDEKQKEVEYLCIENKRLREQNQQLLRERNMWQRKCRELRGL